MQWVKKNLRYRATEWLAWHLQEDQRSVVVLLCMGPIMQRDSGRDWMSAKQFTVQPLEKPYTQIWWTGSTDKKIIWGSYLQTSWYYRRIPSFFQDCSTSLSTQSSRMAVKNEELLLMSKWDDKLELTKLWAIDELKEIAIAREAWSWHQCWKVESPRNPLNNDWYTCCHCVTHPGLCNRSQVSRD